MSIGVNQHIAGSSGDRVSNLQRAAIKAIANANGLQVDRIVKSLCDSRLEDISTTAGASLLVCVSMLGIIRRADSLTAAQICELMPRHEKQILEEAMDRLRNAGYISEQCGTYRMVPNSL